MKSPHLETVKPARVKRLRPGDSAIVQVGVENKHGVEAGSKGPATAVAHWGGGHGAASKTVTATYGIPSYNATPESVNTHEAPEWFRDAKLGIFIHWGLYSIPAYGGVGKNENYAEWYWSSQMSPSDPTRTYQYHLEKYGPEVLYDDFIANFTAEEFRPKEWVDLISDSGAQYFVQVTKHHDGYALFDMPETVSKRNSVKQLPHRDFLRVSKHVEIMRDSAESSRSYSMLRRNTSRIFDGERTSVCRNGSILRIRNMNGLTHSEWVSKAGLSNWASD